MLHDPRMLARLIIAHGRLSLFEQKQLRLLPMVPPPSNRSERTLLALLAALVDGEHALPA